MSGVDALVVVAPLADLVHRLPERLPELRQLGRAEDEEQHGKDDEHFAWPDVHGARVPQAG